MCFHSGGVFFDQGLDDGAVSLDLVLGDLPAGTYMVTTTFVRVDGTESGAPASVGVTVSSAASISVTNISVSNDPLVSRVRIYMTAPNGEVLMEAGEIGNGVTSVSITAVPVFGPALRTQFFGPPPPGQALGTYNGRAYIGAANVLWYTLPYEYELVDLAYGYIVFDSDIQVIAGVVDGIFVGAKSETVFLAGDGPESFVREQVAPYGAVLGTAFAVRNDQVPGSDEPGVVQVWASQKGIAIGQDGGKYVEATSGRYILPSVTEGASVLKIRSGTPQLVTTFFN